ncbi:MAG TPA: GNAT family protein [Candidatus Saccharimonadales bacterium]|nr:GNAT family protein [Candidatus Saccharimonadales bacterium]
MSDNMVTEEAFVDFKCPHCGEQISFPESCAGLVRECFSCLQPLIVPANGGEGRTIPLPVTAPRLVLRKFRGADWKDLLSLVSDEEFFAWTTLGIQPTEESVAKWLEADTAVKLTTPDVPFTLAIEATAEAKVIGYLTLWFPDPDHLQAQIYLALHESFQRKGLGTKVIKAILGFCFEGLSVHRVAASCDSTNTAALRLLEKSGLRREGEFVKDHKTAGQWANAVCYAILREEWTARATQ